MLFVFQTHSFDGIAVSVQTGKLHVYSCQRFTQMTPFKLFPMFRRQVYVSMLSFQSLFISGIGIRRANENSNFHYSSSSTNSRKGIQVQYLLTKFKITTKYFRALIERRRNKELKILRTCAIRIPHPNKVSISNIFSK